MQKKQQQQILNKNNDNNSVIEDKIYYDNFVYSYKTEITRKNSFRILKYFMKFLSVKTLRDLVDNKKKSQQIIESDIKAYLVYLRNEKKISHSTAVLYLSIIKKFYVVNTDYPFRWKLINMYLGNDDTDDDNDTNDNDDSYLDDVEERDRPYTSEEIKQMFNAAQDIRVKLVISLMSSTGIRNSVVNNLKLRDLEKIEKYNIYKITAYRKSKKFRYNTFTTPEATAVIDSYLEYRKNHGEQLKGNSPLIREQFSTNDKLKINNPRHLTSRAIRNMINDILIKYTNLRKKLEYDYENKRKEGRNPTKLTHAFRKFFHTECAKAGVYPDYIELLLGHRLPGVRSHYMIPDINTLLEGTKETKGYVAAINSLTINDENRLKRENESLKEEDEYKEYLIQQKLKQKDSEIEKMQQQLQTLINESNKNKQEFITITKQIQDLHYNRKKADPETLRKLRTGTEGERYEMFLTSMLERKEREEKQKKELVHFIIKQ